MRTVAAVLMLLKGDKDVAIFYGIICVQMHPSSVGLWLCYIFMQLVAPSAVTIALVPARYRISPATPL